MSGTLVRRGSVVACSPSTPTRWDGPVSSLASNSAPHLSRARVTIPGLSHDALTRGDCRARPRPKPLCENFHLIPTPRFCLTSSHQHLHVLKEACMRGADSPCPTEQNVLTHSSGWPTETTSPPDESVPSNQHPFNTTQALLPCRYDRAYKKLLSASRSKSEKALPPNIEH